MEIIYEINWVCTKTHLGSHDALPWNWNISNEINLIAMITNTLASELGGMFDVLHRRIRIIFGELIECLTQK